MRDYEIMFIVRPDVDEEGLKASREKVQSIIAEHDGSLTDEQDMENVVLLIRSSKSRAMNR